MRHTATIIALLVATGASAESGRENMQWFAALGCWSPNGRDCESTPSASAAATVADPKKSDAECMPPAFLNADNKCVIDIRNYGAEQGGPRIVYEIRDWHLLTVTYGGTVSLINDLTKSECEKIASKIPTGGGLMKCDSVGAAVQCHLDNPGAIIKTECLE
jgi:hypothetical protein